MKASDILPKPGQHALLVGQTGSGKTAAACWVLQRLPQSPIVIYDTKGEPKFEALGATIVVEQIGEVIPAAEQVEYDYVIVRPPAYMLNDPTSLDAYLWQHYNDLHRVPAFIDEADTWVDKARGGPGLNSMLRRGRSRGITTILATQRPAWIPRPVITEATHAYIFRLTDRQDRMRLGDLIPGFADTEPAPKYHFWHYEAGEDKPTLFAPLTLDKIMDTGAVDHVPESALEKQARRKLWI